MGVTGMEIRPIQQGRRRVRIASIAAGAGAPAPAFAAPRPATGFPQASAATFWASASLSLLVTERRIRLDLELMERSERTSETEDAAQAECAA